jgi:hypothetical protein
MSTKDFIIIGSRQNDLKNINLTLSHNKVSAITGLPAISFSDDIKNYLPEKFEEVITVLKKDKFVKSQV